MIIQATNCHFVVNSHLRFAKNFILMEKRLASQVAERYWQC